MSTLFLETARSFTQITSDGWYTTSSGNIRISIWIEADGAYMTVSADHSVYFSGDVTALWVLNGSLSRMVLQWSIGPPQHSTCHRIYFRSRRRLAVVASVLYFIIARANMGGLTSLNGPLVFDDQSCEVVERNGSFSS
ncbi:hypothetical protein BD410DRAFT_791362 [Rickenella mellea]|uniref:Uncharacterized protein n=1 Tax=Rickenella mellea TaxID=50990 RepID=A0A4Y7PYA4_9AGAM|nr:hypothetical protein BD410DRAFT_791362 [Rickenella mellea]